MARVQAHLRKVATGEVRVYEIARGADSPDTALFWWTEGNGSCDCNRRDFFADAGGEPREDDDDDDPCSFGRCGETEFELVRLTFGGKEIPLEGETD